jgi:hypothetical protein
MRGIPLTQVGRILFSSPNSLLGLWNMAANPVTHGLTRASFPMHKQHPSVGGESGINLREK